MPVVDSEINTTRSGTGATFDFLVGCAVSGENDRSIYRMSASIDTLKTICSHGQSLFDLIRRAGQNIYSV